MAKIKIKRGLESNIGSITLEDGEFAITTDTKKLYVGLGGQKVLLVNTSTSGDMIKSIYDTDNDGIVDKAETAVDSTKLPLAGGALTGAVTTSSTITASSLANIKGNAPVNTVITPDTSQIAQTPIAPFLWHDILAFCKLCTPTFETSADGSVWLAGTLSKDLFDHKEAQAITCLNSATMKAVRWTWNSSGISWSTIQWLILGITYVANAPNITVTIEGSTDGNTWATKHISTGTYNAEPVWFYINGWAGESYLRVTITLNSGGNVNLSSIRALTARWGDQGQGSELSFPFNWDAVQNIIFSNDVKGASFHRTDGVPVSYSILSSTEPTSPKAGDKWEKIL